MIVHKGPLRGGPASVEADTFPDRLTATGRRRLVELARTGAVAEARSRRAARELAALLRQELPAQLELELRLEEPPAT